MKCPVDDSPLSISSREGIEIDFCPQCRGVWLDRGELDKVIERASGSLAPTGAGRGEERSYDDSRRYEDRPYEDRRPDDRHRGDERDHKKRKRRSFLDDMFDFD
jgi:Zn-finger nucleic acid-binding protein